MTKQEEREARGQYKKLVDEINSACEFLRQQCKDISEETINFMQENALGEAQKRFYQP